MQGLSRAQEFRRLQNGLGRVAENDMLYYNIPMAEHDHPHPTHHHPGHVHPPAQVHPSILRLSAAQRLACAAALIALVWLAVFWATR